MTTVSFEVPAPDNLRPEDEARFFSIAYSEVAKTCGGMKNVTNGYVHNDEKHEYFDPIKKEFVMSRAHMHMQGIAWTDDFGINGKNFMTRERIIELNKRIDERCRKELGISFLKEEVSQHNERWLKVEDMKRESALKLTERNKELEELNKQMKSEAIKRNALIKRLNEKIELQERELNDLNVVDRLKEFLSRDESNRALTLADELTDKRTSELSQRAQNAEIRAYKLEKKVKEVSEEKERWKKSYYSESAENENLRKRNIYLRDTISIMQNAFDKFEKFLKKISFWQRFKSIYRNQDYDEYQRFQSIRHDDSLCAKTNQKRVQTNDLER